MLEFIPGVRRLAVLSDAQALNVLASLLLHGNRRATVAHTTELRLPAIYQWPKTAKECGLLVYGPRFSDVFRQLARQLVKVLGRSYAGRAARRTADQVRIGVNLRTAKASGIDFTADAACPR